MISVREEQMPLATSNRDKGRKASALAELRQRKALEEGRPAVVVANRLKTEQKTHPASKERSVLEVKNDFEAFAPRREIPRTPPRVKPPPTPNEQHRTPVQDSPDSKSGDGGRDKISVTPLKSKENCENIPPGLDVLSDRRVQAPCFTPCRTLSRSPPLRDIDDVPPPPKWEIPRTPLQSDRVVSQASVSSPNQSRLSCIQHGTTQVHPDVTQGNKTTHSSANPSHLTDCPSTPSRLNQQSTTRSPGLSSDTNTTCPLEREPVPTSDNMDDSRMNPAPLTSSSPPISVRRRSDVTLTLPEDLVCNDTDLAFLQRMKNIRYHDQLQTQVLHLDKALRSVAEQKEQLEHRGEKVSHDLQQMKHKYHTTLSDVHEFQSTFEPPDSIRLTTTDSSGGSTLPTELSHTHLARLRHTQQVMMVQLEKADREIQKKVSKINHNRRKLEEAIKEKETQEQSEDVAVIQTEKQEWKEKVQQTSDEHHTMMLQLESLQSQLSQLKLTTATAEEPHHPSVDQDVERQRAEERLQQLIRRCELYVKRHQLLKKLRHN